MMSPCGSGAATTGRRSGMSGLWPSPPVLPSTTLLDARTPSACENTHLTSIHFCFFSDCGQHLVFYTRLKLGLVMWKHRVCRKQLTWIVSRARICLCEVTMKLLQIRFKSWPAGLTCSVFLLDWSGGTPSIHPDFCLITHSMWSICLRNAGQHNREEGLHVQVNCVHTFS